MRNARTFKKTTEADLPVLFHVTISETLCQCIVPKQIFHAHLKVTLKTQQRQADLNYIPTAIAHPVSEFLRDLKHVFIILMRRPQHTCYYFILLHIVTYTATTERNGSPFHISQKPGVRFSPARLCEPAHYFLKRSSLYEQWFDGTEQNP